VNRRTLVRAGSVAALTLALIVASQILASVEPPKGTEVTAGSTTTVPTTTPPPPTTTTVPLPPITGPVRLDERSRLDGPGVGPVEAGMTLGEAEQAAGRRFTVTGHDDPTVRCYSASPDGLVGLALTVQGPADDPRAGKVVRVEATASTWSTVSGARVGSTVDEVRRLYNNRLDKSATTTTARRSSGVTTTTVPPAGLLTVTVRRGSQTFAVGFATSERQIVTAVYSGDAAAVKDPAGCG
jgi:hypothetical protein